MLMTRKMRKRIIIKFASPHVFHLVVYVFLNPSWCSDSLVEFCDVHIVSRDFNYYYMFMMTVLALDLNYPKFNTLESLGAPDAQVLLFVMLEWVPGVLWY